MRLSLIAVLITVPLAASSQSSPPRPTGASLTGLPALNFDADEGLGYGALLQYYDYGTEGASPYRFTLQPTVFLTSKGRRDISLFLDAPHLLPSGWRLNASVARERQQASPYYGVGNATVVDADATTGANKYFYRYGRRTMRGSVNVQRELAGPSLRALVGVGAANVTVNTVPYDEGSTLLSAHMGRGDLPETHARYVRAGLVLDTRDREIGPRRGTWAEVLVQRAGHVLGGDQAFTRATATVRQYTPLGGRLTLAQRVVMQNLSGSVPVQELAIVQGSFKDDEALGGGSSLRGIPKNRYVGKGVAFTNNELRWHAADFSLRGRDARLVLSGFVDAGRVWNDELRFGEVLNDLHMSYGGGARMGIGPSFVVATDVGHSSQTMAAVYIGLGYLF